MFINFRDLEFTGYAVFLVGILLGWAVLLAKDSTVEHLLNHPRTESQDYWFPRGNSSDDDEHKSRWHRFKDWCSRNKVYIGLGILATVAAVTAYFYYSSGSTPPSPPEVNPPSSGDTASDWKERAGLDRLEWVNDSIDFFNKKTIAQVTNEFFSNQTLFSIAVPSSGLTGADILAKEGVFLKQMLTVFDYYKENPPAEEGIRQHLDFMTMFLKYELFILNETDQFQFYNWDSMKKCLTNYGHYLANWEDSPLEFKTLFYFLTQSTTEGAHREALGAFQHIKFDFMTKNLVKSVDL